MSFDLAVWRRSPTTKTAMITEAYAALGAEQGHPAAGAFDTAEFVDAALRRFGSSVPATGGLTWVQVTDDAGEPAEVSLRQVEAGGSSAVLVSGPFDWLTPTRAALLPLVVERDLLLYDVQAQAVFNNRRSYTRG